MNKNKNDYKHQLLVATVFIGFLLIVGYLASMLVSAKEIKVPPVPISTVESALSQKEIEKPRNVTGFEKPKKSSTENLISPAKALAKKQEEELVPPVPNGGRIKDSKVTIDGSKKKEELVPPAPPIGDANLNIRDYINLNYLDLKAYLEQFTTRYPGYALFYDIEHHRFMIVRGSSEEGTPGVQSVSISFADDPDIKDKDHPTTITIIGIMSGDDPYAKYRRTFKMPDQWGEKIHIYGCNDHIYSSQLNAIEATLAAILNHPTGDDLNGSSPNVVYPILTSETFWN